MTFVDRPTTVRCFVVTVRAIKVNYECLAYNEIPFDGITRPEQEHDSLSSFLLCANFL